MLASGTAVLAGGYVGGSGQFVAAAAAVGLGVAVAIAVFAGVPLRLLVATIARSDPSLRLSSICLRLSWAMLPW